MRLPPLTVIVGGFLYEKDHKHQKHRRSGSPVKRL